MAIDVNTARFLVICRQNGVSFRRTLTLGRLNYYLGTKETHQMLRWAGMDANKFPDLMDYGKSRYVEPFLAALGAEKVESMDASGFEGATVIHDLNLPVDENLKEQFDVVCDGGTIEHVFNFPVAIRNCMEMVAVGGHLILTSPANNYFGHGFYQFTPELWFRLLSSARGFEVRRMVALEIAPVARWFDVADPETVRDRVYMTNRYPVVLMVLARRTSRAMDFQSYPQQSDYVPRWEGEGDPSNRRPPAQVRLRRLLLETFPRVARFLENFYQTSPFNRKYSLRNRKFFKRVAR